MDGQAKVAQLGPYQVHLQAGQTYLWCVCGNSSRQPFCDGSHNGSTFTPLRFTAETSGVFNLCGCKATDDKPFCDGSHNML